MTLAIPQERPNAENTSYVKLTTPISIGGVPLQGNRRWVAGEAFVYRLFDDRDRLLWIGTTTDLRRRLRQHRARKSWWPEVTRCEAQWFDNTGDAATAEIAALWAERPKYNIMLVGGRRLSYRRAA